LPWLTIRNNICIPLALQNLPRIEKKIKLTETLEKLKFSNLPLEYYPHQISGGQRQKVAIARALIQEPDILILDEPFSNLDNTTSFELQDIIQDIHTQNNISILLVSHNIDQVLYLADRILVLGEHPSTIIKEFKVPFKRKRNRELIVSKEFAEYRNRILEFEYETIR
jgi:NitT/TauT family transport system ATP-binding protein